VKFVQEGVPFTHPYVDLVDSIQSLMYKELQLVLVRTPYEKGMKMLIDMLNWEHLLLIVSQVHLIIVVKKEC
jgi:hypothetical protein